MNPNIFNIDYKKLRWLVPQPLRLTGVMAAVNACVASVVFNYQFFLRNRNTNLYRLAITPQVCYLEKMLNDRFDFALRRIYIADAIWYSPWYLYQEPELKPQWLYQEPELKPIYVFTDGEAGLLQDDFVVFVPSTLVFNMPEMMGLLNIYKLGGIHYNIQLV